VVAVGARDGWWDTLPCAALSKLRRVQGGAERCHSVLNALSALSAFAADDDWVLVHDAARPCLRAADIDRLLDTLASHPVGGILAVPVRDTIKRGDAEGKITATVDRNGLWQAQTPQMFRLATLRSALERVLAAGRIVTDEAQAVELDGGRPVLVEGHVDNIKITQPQDMKLAELFLRQQEEERTCA
jgi:2-C-methyl-D-erythritol 4-phosphate cytidylyltransferase